MMDTGSDGDDDDDAVEMIEVSAKYQISMSPGGTLYSSVPPTTPEEEEFQQRQFDAYMAEVGGGEDVFEELGPFVMDELKMEIQNIGSDEDEDDEAEQASSSRKRKGKTVKIATYRCDYVGCGKRFNTVPLQCPDPNQADNDLNQRFCSYECMSAWADYEIGDPLRERLHVLIEQRADRPVTSAPPPFELFACSTTSKSVHLDFGPGE